LSVRLSAKRGRLENPQPDLPDSGVHEWARTLTCEGLSQLDTVLLSEEDGVDERIGGTRGVAVFQLDGACCVRPVAETLEEEVHVWQVIVDASLKGEVSRKSFAAPTYVACDRIDKHQAHGPCGCCSSH
jgi:hypothetical protein